MLIAISSADDGRKHSMTYYRQIVLKALQTLVAIRSLVSVQQNNLLSRYYIAPTIGSHERWRLLSFIVDLTQENNTEQEVSRARQTRSVRAVSRILADRTSGERTAHAHA